MTMMQVEQKDEDAGYKAVMTYLEQQWHMWCSADLPNFKRRYAF